MSLVSLSTCLSLPLLREALGMTMWVAMADMMIIIHLKTLRELIQAVPSAIRCAQHNNTLNMQSLSNFCRNYVQYCQYRGFCSKCCVCCWMYVTRTKWRKHTQLLYILMCVACFSNVSWGLTVVSLQLTLLLLAVSSIITGARCSPHFVLAVWGRKACQALRGFCTIHHNKPAHCTSSVASSVVRTEPPLSYRYNRYNATITLLWTVSSDKVST